MSINVLVTDDSAVMRKMVIKTLQISGIPVGEIYEAANGQEGLKMLKENWIDLALVDINMPVMNGEEMVDKIRQDEEIKNTPVIIISTESSENRINLLMKKGVGFVHKPFSPEILKDYILEKVGVLDEK